MKTQLLISTFFVTILFAKANAKTAFDRFAWKNAADKTCQSVCQNPEAYGYYNDNIDGDLFFGCDADCACGKHTNLPDETECVVRADVVIVRYGVDYPPVVFGKCASGKCVALPPSKRR